MDRERWLHAATDILRERFSAAGYPLPELVHLSTGFPSKASLSRRRRRVGECWPAALSADGVSHVFVSPLLTEGIEVLDVLVHELVHVVTPGAGHKAGFTKACRAIGLTKGPATSQAAGEELRAALRALIPTIGAYPHAGLRVATNEEKQTTRLLKVECSECGYTVRVTRKWLDAAGAPLCPIHESPMDVV